MLVDTPGLHTSAHAARRAAERRWCGTTLGRGRRRRRCACRRTSEIGRGRQAHRARELAQRPGGADRGRRRHQDRPGGQVRCGSPRHLLAHRRSLGSRRRHGSGRRSFRCRPVSGEPGRGCSRRCWPRCCPEGPLLYPEGELTDAPEQILVAELIREAALEGVRDELPHSLAVVVEEMGPARGPRSADQPAAGRPRQPVRRTLQSEGASSSATRAARGCATSAPTRGDARSRRCSARRCTSTCT